MTLRFLNRWVVASALVLSAGVLAVQAKENEKDAAPASAKHDQVAAAETGSAKLDAMLVDPEKKAKEKTATVKVTVSGIKIVDPATEGEKPVAGEGHLHYQVDNDPVVATTAPKLSFHELKSGKHTIKVILAGNDHAPLGPEKTLTVEIP